MRRLSGAEQNGTGVSRHPIGARALLGSTVAVALVATLASGTADAVPAPAAAATTASTGLPAADVPEPGGYRAVAAARLVDTRTTGTRLARGASLPVPVLGRQGVPSAGVGAVQLHVTAVGATRASHLTVHPSDAAPTTSSVNFEASRPVANTVTVRPGADGAVTVTNGGSDVDVVVDLVGWFAAPSGSLGEGVHAVSPRRVWDSRATGRPVGVGGATVVVVGGAVPTGARAVVVNLTTVGAGASGLPLLSWAAGAARPKTSNGNTVRGAAVATQVVVGVGDGGRIAVATGTGTTHVVVDVVGYVVSPRQATAAADGALRSVSPVRLVDTRTTGVPLASGRRLVQQVTGRGGVPAGASAALLTITSVPGPTASGTLVAVGNGEARPPTSDLNARVDVPVARQVLTPLGVDGGIAVIRTGGTGHVVVDLVGYATAVPLPTVLPPSAELLAAGVPSGTVASQATQVLRGTVRYGLSTWWHDTAPALLSRPMDSLAQSDRTDAVRRLSMEALGISTALATGLYDDTDAGMSKDQAVDVLRTVVDRVACRHRATVVGGWGQSWQSTMWSSLAARAAWLSWGAMPEGTRDCVRAMVVSEADFATRLRPVVMATPDGVVVRPGNSGSEENSWAALAPAVAVAMMPAAERRDAWRAGQVRLLASSWNRAAQLEQDVWLDGVALADLVAGYNVEADGSVINHDRIAPDYSTNAYQNIDAVLLANLAGHSAPEAALHGLREVYAALATNVYSAEQVYRAPGGTVYDPVAPLARPFGVYYPQGCDWGEGQVLPYALFDAQAAAFGFGGPQGTPTDASAAMRRHLAETVTMQGRSTDGRLYSGSAEYTYVGREEHSAQLAAQLVLTLVLTRGGADPEAVAPADLDLGLDDQLRAPPAPTDESRLMQDGSAGG
jgi:hypothetical protein